MKLIKTFTTPTDLYLLGNDYTGELFPSFSLTDNEQTLDIVYKNTINTINTYGHVYLIEKEEFIKQIHLAKEQEEDINDFYLFKKSFKGSIYVKLLNGDDFYDVDEKKRISYILNTEDCFVDDIDLIKYLTWQVKGELYDKDDYFPSIVVLILKEDEN